MVGRCRDVTPAIQPVEVSIRHSLRKPACHARRRIAIVGAVPHGHRHHDLCGKLGFGERCCIGLGLTRGSPARADPLIQSIGLPGR